MLEEDQRMQMMYTGLANCFCTERTLTWSRNQLFTVINLGGLSIAAVPQAPNALRYIVAVAFSALCVLWIFMNQRMRKRIHYWQDCLARIEPSETFLAAHRVFTGHGSHVIRKSYWFYAIHFLPMVFIAMWIVALLVTFLA